VVGNVPPSVVLQRAARIWGIWVRGDDVPFTFLPPRIPAGRQIFLEDDPNSAAAQFITGNLFPRREDPAFVAASLAAQILQERLTKLLPNSLLTVGYDGRRLSSPFYVQGQAAANEAANELQNIRNAAEELKKTPPSQEELDAIQKKVIGDFYQELLTTSGICKLMLDAELYRLGSNYAVLFPDQVLRCDVDSIKDAANKYIFPGGEVILIRGPGTMLKQNLESLGPVRPLGP
jgi:predicted Zn-dependent peptidase